MSKILGLDYKIQYKKGCENVVADAHLRRLGRQDDFANHCVLAISEVQPSWI